MKRSFAIVVAVDVLALALPTRWMGAWVEFWIAVALAVVTAALWLVIQLTRDH